jgi:hypothetical protein
MIRVLLSVLVATTFAAADPTEQAKPNGFREFLSGTWGSEYEGSKCSDNPHTLKLSADGQSMVLAYAKSLNSEPPTRVEYRIIGEGKDFVRTQKLSEKETAADGSLVMWDIVILTPDSYCWHRSDWSDEGCTKPIVRCKPEAKP